MRAARAAMGVYNKHPNVWTPFGGWYSDPKQWKRNTVMAGIGMASILVPAFMYSASIEVRAATTAANGVGAAPAQCQADARECYVLWTAPRVRSYPRPRVLCLTACRCPRRDLRLSSFGALQRPRWSASLDAALG